MTKISGLGQEIKQEKALQICLVIGEAVQLLAKAQQVRELAQGAANGYMGKLDGPPGDTSTGAPSNGRLAELSYLLQRIGVELQDIENAVNRF